MSRETNDKRLSKIEAAIGKEIDPRAKLMTAITQKLVLHVLDGRRGDWFGHPRDLSIEMIMTWRVIDDVEMLDNFEKLGLSFDRADKEQVASICHYFLLQAWKEIDAHKAKKAAA